MKEQNGTSDKIPILRDWYVCRGGIAGKIFNCSYTRFKEGKKIITSLIESLDGEVVTTVNKHQYRLDAETGPIKLVEHILGFRRMIEEDEDDDF